MHGFKSGARGHEIDTFLHEWLATCAKKFRLPKGAILGTKCKKALFNIYGMIQFFPFVDFFLSPVKLGGMANFKP